MIKVIVFDYGGVIGNDPSKAIYEAVADNYSLKAYQLKAEFLKFVVLLEKDNIPENSFWNAMARNLGIDNSEKLEALWIKEFRKQARLNRKMLFLLRKLREDYRLCLLSNNARFYQKTSINQLLKKLFSTIIYSYQVGMRKPEAGIYSLLLEKINFRPEETLVVDDNETNLLVPQELRMKTISFKSFPKFVSELETVLKVGCGRIKEGVK